MEKIKANKFFNPDWRYEVSQWELVPADLIKSVSKKEAWSSVLKEMVEYIKSLPEFDKNIFIQVTDCEELLK